MKKHKRILLLGPTGVDKAAAMERLQHFVGEKFGQGFRFVDFEKDFLKKHIDKQGIRSWTTFLAQDISRQSVIWQTAWKEFEETLSDDITILGLHATYVSGISGLRSPIHLPSLCNGFKPTLIITLIDDVQSMWCRTETRAGGQEVIGRPTLEQLLSARRAEQLLGDMMQAHMDVPCRHVVCGGGNALASLANLIIFDADVIYLSFPISVPRVMAENGDRQFIEVINGAHQRAVAEMMKSNKRAFITPLAIDELPLVKKSEAGEGEFIQFNCASDRWDSGELWGSPDVSISPRLDKIVSIPQSQVRDAMGIMRTDVGWRDRRLVLQSNSLAIVCPKDPDQDRITRGVREEIETAVAVGIPCRYWQEPSWDLKKFVERQFPAAGSMGIGQTQALVQRVESLEKLLSAEA